MRRTETEAEKGVGSAGTGGVGRENGGGALWLGEGPGSPRSFAPTVGLGQ